MYFIIDITKQKKLKQTACITRQSQFQAGLQACSPLVAALSKPQASPKQAARAHLQFFAVDLAPRLPDYFLAAAATQRPPIPAARSDQSPATCLMLGPPPTKFPLPLRPAWRHVSASTKGSAEETHSLTPISSPVTGSFLFLLPFPFKFLFSLSFSASLCSSAAPP